MLLTIQVTLNSRSIAENANETMTYDSLVLYKFPPSPFYRPFFQVNLGKPVLL